MFLQHSIIINYYYFLEFSSKGSCESPQSSNRKCWWHLVSFSSMDSVECLIPNQCHSGSLYKLECGLFFTSFLLSASLPSTILLMVQYIIVQSYPPPTLKLRRGSVTGFSQQSEESDLYHI